MRTNNGRRRKITDFHSKTTGCGADCCNSRAQCRYNDRMIPLLPPQRIAALCRPAVLRVAIEVAAGDVSLRQYTKG